MEEKLKVTLSGSPDAVKRLKDVNCVLSKLLDESDPPESFREGEWDKTIWSKSV